MNRGRPLGSHIRKNIAEILYFLGEGYAYDLSRIYLDIFPKVSRRSIYYHLKKGTETQEFVVKEIRKERGEYSWGPEAEKIYYALGPSAAPQAVQVVKAYLDKKKKQ